MMDMLSILTTSGRRELIPELRQFGRYAGSADIFAQILGGKPEEVIVGGNSSLNMMYYLVEFWAGSGFADSPRPWSAGKPKFSARLPVMIVIFE